MKIRAYTPNDIPAVKKIYNKHYSHEFEFPDFMNGFICAFVVTDDHDQIIAAGGVRTIAESVLVTDKDCSTKSKILALCQVLDASEFVTKHAEFGELHAFIQDDRWYSILQKVGFAPTKGKALVLELDRK